ncbi:MULTISPECIES: acyl-CoA dehydrogenase family protein [unclassified Streptomyces]|uniref:acyl-CoA dehydrogenase family protein n=1 Tax=unclassified Streptomyces TaxID=2593676 RepID=UPI00247604B7|nr:MULTISPECIES: acyl-CoA dehydrogenase family protein [unclassified Streptomyces]MDH6447853.1 alkylation response protein AidB-like acyl-CoA dehydrogenase [Streptomyces sp. SAI-119]MDH6501424.1 alkylation response protein AidB-like acyl-CoA dehydrogenase [Streptomyces sp. SAI-149]
MDGIPAPDDFRAEARSWLKSVATARAADREWGSGDDSVAVFENWTEAEERARTDLARDWERTRHDQGWGALAWPQEYGGRELPAHYEQLYRAEEAAFDVPRRTEIFPVTQQLVAPAIRVWGTPEQRRRWLRPMLRTDELACQLFSETEAGSDLAAVRTRAVRDGDGDGDGWILRGHKVWTSGARVATWGVAVCRTDPDVPRHAGITVFLVRMDAPGVTVRPIRQMTGGASFNEVYLDDVHVPDTDRLGPVGEGWRVTLTVLAAERLDSGGLGLDNADRALDLARHLPRPLTGGERQQAADLFVHALVQRLTGLRVNSALAAGREPGAEASVGKLHATATMRATTDLVQQLLGPRLGADTGEWGTFAWTEHLLGAPGYRIAGGSDEIQRNILAERVLGLPKEPKGQGR